MLKNYDERIGNLLKAELVLSDYTLATDPEERKIHLAMLDRYIMTLDDPTLSLYFVRFTTTSDETEKDLYIEILMELFAERKNTPEALAV